MVELATKYGRYGYRRIAALLQKEGLEGNRKRVERLLRKQDFTIVTSQCTELLASST